MHTNASWETDRIWKFSQFEEKGASLHVLRAHRPKKVVRTTGLLAAGVFERGLGPTADMRRYMETSTTGWHHGGSSNVTCECKRT